MKQKNRIIQILKNKNLLSLFWIFFYAVFDAGNFFILIRSYPKTVFGEIVFFFTCIAVIDNIMNGYVYYPLIRFSGAAVSDEEKKAVTGSIWLLNILGAVCISLICGILLLIFFPLIRSSIFFNFIIFCPLILLCSIPLNNLKSQLQSQNKFLEMILFQSACNIPYFIFLILNCFFLKLPVNSVFAAYAVSLGLASLAALFSGRSGISLMKNIKKKTMTALHNFGIYSLGSNISSILLRNLPVILIGVILSKLDEALFGIPFKLIAIFSIPLEAAAMVAYNKMLIATAEKDYGRILDIYYRYTGVLLILFIPGLILSCVFAKPIIYIFAGSGYSEVAKCIIIFRLFLLYIIFLTIDRLGGAILNSINRPRYDFIKVTIMLLTNTTGIISVMYIFKTIEPVAVIYILTIAAGMCIGILFVNKYLKLNLGLIFPAGWAEIKRLIQKIKTR
ncbi:MAG: oligosaccharide flippase family protein [Spirochaetales bacterium]|nr:oligosaccharide flippase family protein [Spirochaetales bacterium]